MRRLVRMWLRCKNPVHCLEVLGKYSKSRWILQTSALSDTPFKKPKLAPLQERRMIDCRRLWAKGGDGGNGCFSFHRSRHDRRGKPDDWVSGSCVRGLVLLSADQVRESFLPYRVSILVTICRSEWMVRNITSHQVRVSYLVRGGQQLVNIPLVFLNILYVGGNGGRGGDVILECSSTVWDLSGLQHHINAKRGGHGASKNKIGSRGDDKVVLVPIGTVLHLVEGDPPSVVGKGSSAALNPWEIGGSLEPNQHGTSPQPTSSKDSSSSKNNGSFTKENKTPPNSSSTQLSQPSNKFNVDLEGFNFWEEEKMNSWEARVTGTGVPESEPENKTEETEEEGEEQHIEYNVAELTEPGQRVIVAHGGDGGLGNISVLKPFKNLSHKKHGGVEKADNLDAEEHEDETNSPLRLGSPGSESVLILELKSIADVGLVGMPNAGKNTLLGALSKAQPRIGHYAFTTLRPNLGNLTYDDISVTVADIPGLIKGAHENRGLGHAFLRHIERTRVLAYVLDLASGLDGRKGVPPWEQLIDLIMELEFYNEGLSGRPALIVANKIDETGAGEVYEELRRRVTGVKIFPVCAVLEEGIPELKDGLRMLVGGEDSNQLTLDGIDVD